VVVHQTGKADRCLRRLDSDNASEVLAFPCGERSAVRATRSFGGCRYPTALSLLRVNSPKMRASVGSLTHPGVRAQRACARWGLAFARRSPEDGTDDLATSPPPDRPKPRRQDIRCDRGHDLSQRLQLGAVLPLDARVGPHPWGRNRFSRFHVPIRSTDRLPLDRSAPPSSHEQSAPLQQRRSQVRCIEWLSLELQVRGEADLGHRLLRGIRQTLSRPIERSKTSTLSPPSRLWRLRAPRIRAQDERCGRRGATPTNTPTQALQPWV
jgi:hypothetical protein